MASTFRASARRRSASSSVSAPIRSAVSSIRPANRSTRSFTRTRRTFAVTLTLCVCSMMSVCRRAVFGAQAEATARLATMAAAVHHHRGLAALVSLIDAPSSCNGGPRPSRTTRLPSAEQDRCRPSSMVEPAPMLPPRSPGPRHVVTGQPSWWLAAGGAGSHLGPCLAPEGPARHTRGGGSMSAAGHDPLPRRRFLGLSAAGTLGALGDLGLLGGLPPVPAQDARVDPARVRLRPEIEPLVRLLEETPQERVLEELGARIRRGLGYPDALAALLLAGVRNIQPRPVGFKFHAVLV